MQNKTDKKAAWQTAAQNEIRPKQPEPLTRDNFYPELKRRFLALLEKERLLDEEIRITARALSPEEAIGVTKRRDFPILTGKDVMIQADCLGAAGQAFTDAPADFAGTLRDIARLDLARPHDRGLFIAALNAVMHALGKCRCTVHCRNDGPELCAADAAEKIAAEWGNPNIALIGYQPALLERLSARFRVRAVDLNPANVGQTRCGVLIEDGSHTQEITHGWADLILSTGSTICNGTIVDFLDQPEKTLFYGTSLAGAAELTGLSRLCFAEKYQ